MIKLGTNIIGKMYLGETEISKAYLGDTKTFDSGSSPSPPAPILPDGYTQIDYVSNAGNYISTNITANGSEWELELQMDTAPTGWQIIIGTSDYLGRFFGVNSNGYFSIGSDASYNIEQCTTRGKFTVSFGTKSVSVTYNNTTKTFERSGYAGGSYLFLIGINSPGYIYKGKCYGIKCVTGGSFNGIPAQRDSDSHQGLYDIVNNVFYDLS